MNSDNKSKEIILSICLGLLIFYFIFKAETLIHILLVFLVMGTFSSFLSSKIAMLWMGLGKILGFISSRILLSIVFYFVLTPIAFFTKLLKNQNKDAEKTAFVFRNHVYNEKDFLRPF